MAEAYIHKDKLDEMKRELNFQLNVCDKCSVYNSGANCAKEMLHDCMEENYKEAQARNK